MSKALTRRVLIEKYHIRTVIIDNVRDASSFYRDNTWYENFVGRSFFVKETHIGNMNAYYFRVVDGSFSGMTIYKKHCRIANIIRYMRT